VAEEKRLRLRVREAKPSGRAAVGPDVKQEIAGILMILTGIWFLLSLYGKGGGQLGEVLSRGLVAIAGGSGAWLLALVLTVTGGYLLMLRLSRRSFAWSPRKWGLLLFFLSFELASHLWWGRHIPAWDDWANALLGNGGGMIGWALAVPITKLFGTSGRWVVLTAGILVGAVLAFEVSFGMLINWVKNRILALAAFWRELGRDFLRLGSGLRP
jgi:DNA segregation ATPase FtsK/SpoIIIE, S-DNA-T family